MLEKESCHSIWSWGFFWVSIAAHSSRWFTCGVITGATSSWKLSKSDVEVVLNKSQNSPPPPFPPPFLLLSSYPLHRKVPKSCYKPIVALLTHDKIWYLDPQMNNTYSDFSGANNLPHPYMLPVISEKPQLYPLVICCYPFVPLPELAEDLQFFPFHMVDYFSSM